MLAAAPQDTIEAALTRAGAPDGYLPSWKKVVASDDGLLFLERASCPSDHPPREWDVVDADRRYVGSFTLPADANLAGGSRAWLAVAAVDSMDVERLYMYRWSRDGRHPDR